ncbi:MAG: Ig-like domain-containing protein [Thermoleophilia bacterium]
MRGNRTRWLAAGIGGAAIATAAGFTGWQFAERPAVASVSPAADSSVPTSAPSITVNLEHVDRLRDLRVRVDGQDRTTAVRAARDRLMVPTEGLDDGAHTVEVEFRTSNLVRRRVREQWEFTVDTRAPNLSARSPQDGKISSRKAVKFTGRAEPGSTVSVNWGNGRSATGTATEAGAYALTARLPEGRVATTVAARDAAGNATRTTTRVIVDTIAPKITLDQTRPAAVVTDTASPRITGLVVKDLVRAS